MSEEEIPSEKTKLSPRMKIVGLNLLILVIYTSISASAGEGGGPLIDSLFLFAHVITCLIVGSSSGKRTWFLSAVLILLIGFSTCVGILWKL